MADKKEDGIFLGVVAHSYDIPTVGEGLQRDCMECPVCDMKIVGSGLHVYGYVVNPAVHERKVAAWRMQASGEENPLFEGDEKLLSQVNMPLAMRVNFYCHDYQCFALFLRNKYVAHPGVLPYDADDSEKFKALDGDDLFGEMIRQLVANDEKVLPKET